MDKLQVPISAIMRRFSWQALLQRKPGHRAVAEIPRHCPGV